MISWLRFPQLLRHNRHGQELQQGGVGRIEGSGAANCTITGKRRQVAATGSGRAAATSYGRAHQAALSDNLIRSTFPISSSRAKIAPQQRL
jgi:hypothetical protein